MGGSRGHQLVYYILGDVSFKIAVKCEMMKVVEWCWFHVISSYVARINFEFCLYAVIYGVRIGPNAKRDFRTNKQRTFAPTSNAPSQKHNFTQRANE